MCLWPFSLILDSTPREDESAGFDDDAGRAGDAWVLKVFNALNHDSNFRPISNTTVVVL